MGFLIFMGITALNHESYERRRVISTTVGSNSDSNSRSTRVPRDVYLAVSGCVSSLGGSMLDFPFGTSPRSRSFR